MTEPFDFIDRLQVRIAGLAIGRSTLRNQGASGMVDCARKYLRKVDLRLFSVGTVEQFQKVLQKQTKQLADSFPDGGKGNWGAARKSLNIFLRDVVYCRPLCEHYKLADLEPWLEVPLDSNVYAGLLKDADKPEDVVCWPKLKKLELEDSNKLQIVASAIAGKFHVARVHLDVRYWRKAALDKLES
jgi:hypothetical protein